MDDSRSPSTSASRLKLAALIIGVFIFFNIFPVNRQLRDQPAGLFSTGWAMYHGAGSGVCDVRYYDAPANTDRTYIKRWAVLGFQHPDELPKTLSHLGRRDLRGHHRRLCGAWRKMHDEPRPLYPEVRCTDRPRKDGWEVVLDGHEDVCAKPKSKGCNGKRGIRSSRRKK